MRFLVVFVFSLIKLSGAKPFPPSLPAPYPPESEGRPVTRVVTAVFTAVGSFSRTLSGGVTKTQIEESSVYIKTDPSADISNSGSLPDNSNNVGSSDILSRADSTDYLNRGRPVDNLNRGESIVDNNRQVSSDNSKRIGSSNGNNNRPSPTYNSAFAGSSDNSNHGGPSDNYNRPGSTFNSNRDGSSDDNNRLSPTYSNKPAASSDKSNRDGSSESYSRPGSNFNSNSGGSSDSYNRDGANSNYNRPDAPASLNRDAFESTTYYAPYYLETTTKRNDSWNPTSYQGVNYQNKQNFQRPTSTANNSSHRNSNNQMQMVPDMNPIFHPNQKISIAIEYPTMNYETNIEYSTRAPLKRPNKNRHKQKNPSES